MLRLVDELFEWSQRYNLTAIRTREGMFTHHLLDSLSVLPFLHGSRIADVGTGAGFPGLPLAIVEPQRQFTLIDSTAKKIRFVTHAARALGLANVTALHARFEALPQPTRFDTVLARAVAPLPALLTAVAPLCDSATRVVALKGKIPRDELAKLPPGWRLLGIEQVTVPDLAAERHVLTLALDSPT